MERVSKRPINGCYLGRFEGGFEPVMVFDSDSSGMKPRVPIEFLPFPPTVCVGFLSEVRNKEINVRDCRLPVLKGLNCLKATFELFVDILHQVRCPG